MSERSINEILGWTEHTMDSALIHMYRPPEGYWREAPDIDDMLAWLRERVGWEAFEVEVSVDGYRVILDHEDDDYAEVLCPADEPAPTLHAALEDAVRVVAEWGEQS